ncbi:hypothetical protein SEMRO_2790_G337160.1 [Seminavis robusta]|uniref:Uncharacterized protein n=1 Tax=Seminavis robusta TaxID=568900 RepID=A0A9N8F288_9STRA|nr:hypothetical protein SEMRO_2790_G337160.1 [Seminavis robusta]|eukprot:Sro2790_g337160.1 n/a (217) ;mRNA; f:6784-7434
MNNNSNRRAPLIQKLTMTMVDPRDGSLVIIGVRAKIPDGTGPLQVELLPVIGSFDEEAVGFAPIRDQERDVSLPRIPCPPLVDLTNEEGPPLVDLTNEEDEETKSETNEDEEPSDEESTDEEPSDEEPSNPEEEAFEEKESSDDSEDESAFAEDFAELDTVDEAETVAVENNTAARLPTRLPTRRNPRRSRRNTRAAQLDEDDADLAVFPMSQDYF